MAFVILLGYLLKACYAYGSRCVAKIAQFFGGSPIVSLPGMTPFRAHLWPSELPIFREKVIIIGADAPSVRCLRRTAEASPR